MWTLARGALVLLALSAALLPLPSHAIEASYSGWLYPAIQTTVTPLTNAVPVALFDVAALVILFVLVLSTWRRVRRYGAAGGLARTGVTLTVLTAVLYLAFLVMWGLNYRRVPLDQKIDFDRARVTHEGAVRLGLTAVQKVNAAHAAAHSQANVDAGLAANLVSAQRLLGQTWSAVPGVPKRSLLELYFRKAAIDGMTDPYFLEVIVNPDTLPFERPFVVAHEWAHLAGYADEAEANFVAWLSCLQGGAAEQYSGWLSIYEHVNAVLPKPDRATLAAQLAPGPRADIDLMVARYARSSPVVRDAARDVYDTYLRANRVREGIASYTGVVRLILGAGIEDGRPPRVR